MDAETGSRVLSAASDLVEVYCVSYEHAELVAREEGASVQRGHPLRRAGDRGSLRG
jgi:hypothetical protein